MTDKMDIVDRLRGYYDKYDDAFPYDLLTEAADEIERLRDEVAYWKHRSA